MFVGILQVDLEITGARTLKEKRQVVKSVLDRLRASFNVSTAEVDDHDLYQRAALGFSAVENIQYLQYLTSLEAIARGFAGPVVHIVFASIWGYYIGRAWLCRRALTRTVIAALAFTAAAGSSAKCRT